MADLTFNLAMICAATVGKPKRENERTGPEQETEQGNQHQPLTTRWRPAGIEPASQP